MTGTGVVWTGVAMMAIVVGVLAGGFDDLTSGMKGAIVVGIGGSVTAVLETGAD